MNNEKQSMELEKLNHELIYWIESALQKADEEDAAIAAFKNDEKRRGGLPDEQ